MAVIYNDEGATGGCCKSLSCHPEPAIVKMGTGKLMSQGKDAPEQVLMNLLDARIARKALRSVTN